MAHLLVVEDDVHIQRLVQTCLTEAGYRVTVAADGRVAVDLAEKTTFDLVVLDVRLPGFDGREVCRRLRKKSRVPVLMLTALGEMHQKLQGFEAGADDYLTKPFEAVELLARVKALLRRSGSDSEEPTPLSLGRLLLDGENLSVEDGTTTHRLSAKDFHLLEIFARDPGRLFTRDQLLDKVWGQDFAGSDRTVDVYVNRLRTRFPEEAFHFRIVPVRGVGYRLEVNS